MTAPGARLAGKLALITGASRGIGRAVAERFAAEGAHVILVARTSGGLEEADDAIKARGGQATLVPLDLTDFDAIDRMGQALFDRWKKLDIVVGNAGILGELTPMAHLEPKIWSRVLDVNLTANWRLIRSLDPLLRAGPAGRAMFVTSGITRHVVPYWAAYAVTKAALEKMVLTYAAETANSNLRVNLINPGPARTAMRRAAFPGEDPQSIADPAELTEAFVMLAEEKCTLHGQWVAADQWAAPAGQRH